MNISKDARLVVQDHISIANAANALLRMRTGLGRLGAAWIVRRRRAREAQILAAFSDRELWDLGLSRSDLLAVTSGTYRRD